MLCPLAGTIIRLRASRGSNVHPGQSESQTLFYFCACVQGCRNAQYTATGNRVGATRLRVSGQSNLAARFSSSLRIRQAGMRGGD